MRAMSFSPQPLSYCTNVHRAMTLAEIHADLDRFEVPVARNIGRPLAVGFWLAQPVIAEILARPAAAQDLTQALRSRRLTCYTLNAFPLGNFHDRRVKQNVYLPDWSQSQRLAYTCDGAGVLAQLLEAGSEGSISTLPLGFKGFDHPPEFLDAAMDNVLECARHLDRLKNFTGRLIRLAIEPEPLCVLETTPETIAFFEILWRLAEQRHLGDIVRRHVGVCFDVCHQAVEFENVAASIAAFAAAGIRINKVHLSCAIQLDDPDRRELLRPYVEERYLHQVIARHGDGRIAKAADLTDSLLTQPPLDFAGADVWRIHFHVPINLPSLGPLPTTQGDLAAALSAVAKLDYAPHLEVETYTWNVMPQKPDDLAAAIAAELNAAYRLISDGA